MMISYVKNTFGEKDDTDFYSLKHREKKQTLFLVGLIA